MRGVARDEEKTRGAVRCGAVQTTGNIIRGREGKGGGGRRSQLPSPASISPLKSSMPISMNTTAGSNVTLPTSRSNPTYPILFQSKTVEWRGRRGDGRTGVGAPGHD